MLSGMKPRLHVPMLLCLGLAASAGAASDLPPARGERFAADWQAQGLQPVATRSLDLLYLRPGPAATFGAMRIEPVSVELREGWQRANRALERARLRPGEEQVLKDQVAAIVADELREAFGAGASTPGGDAPVLQVRVLDLYLNAPEMQAAVASKTYTSAFGDMVLVAELRASPGGPLLLASWDHRPAREHVTPRLTTRVENAVEIRAAARGWARMLRRELDRLGSRG